MTRGGVTEDGDWRASETSQLSNTLDLLVSIEQLVADGTGALSIDGGPSGGLVLLKEGRICWAMTWDRPRRLTEILLHNAERPVAAEALGDLFRRCARERTPLAASLLRAGVVSEQGLKRALLEHNCEAITRLGSARPDLSLAKWDPHAWASYDARFAFSTTTIFTTIASARLPAISAAARREMGALASSAKVTIAFASLERPPCLYPIAEMGDGPLGLSALLDLGRFAADSLEFATELGIAAELLVAGSNRKGKVITWHRDGLVFVACCTKNAAARFISHWHSMRS